MAPKPKGRGKGRGRSQNDVPGNNESTCNQTGNDLTSSKSIVNGRGRGRASGRNDVPESNGSLSQTEDISMSQLSIGNEIVPLPHHSKKSQVLLSRPGFGTAGRKISLEVNYYQMKCNSDVVYHYDVDITSVDVLKKYGKITKSTNESATMLDKQIEKSFGKARSMQIFEHFARQESISQFHPVYDGMKNLFTSKPLPFSTKMTFPISIEWNGRQRKYEVSIQPVKKDDGTNIIKLNAKESPKFEEILMAYNAIMNYRDPSNELNDVYIGRSFFSLTDRRTELGEGMEIWFGYNQSIHMTQTGPSIIINQSAKAFHKSGPVLKYVSDLLHRDVTEGQLRSYEIDKIEEALKGVRVYSTHLPYKRRHIVLGVTQKNADQLRVDVNGKNITITEYFRAKYKPLKYPYLPCLHMKPDTKKTFIPFENCEVMECQPVQGKPSPQITSKMITQTAVPPNERFRAIQNSVNKVGKQCSKKMEQFGIFMDFSPRNVEGRVLDPPDLEYEGKKLYKPDGRGVWRMDGSQFYKPSNNISSWSILSCVPDRNCSMRSIQDFAEKLIMTGRKVGLNFGRFLGIKLASRDSETELNEIAKSNVSFCIIVVSRQNERKLSYDELKFIADCKLELVTQCIESRVLYRINEQILVNLCLKLNAKLGGINHILKKRPLVFSKPAIVLGADVIHAPRGAGCPSIASVVGSLDAFVSKYKVACRVQENPEGNKISQEKILDMESMVKSILKAFYDNTKGLYPEKVIFYRDGVSEGQFLKVSEYEIENVQRACKKVIGKIVPITYIVVQKRHQTRFRPKNPKDGIGKGGNVPPGTTVDKSITHPHNFDYFLNSHEGIQGTSKPAHYTVLYDDNNFTADEIQELSYHMCYTYAKCNRSISIPTAVAYADLGCFRAKKYADFHLKELKRSSRGMEVKLPDHVINAINSMENNKGSMFYV